jgi:hypothetical protein
MDNKDDNWVQRCKLYVWRGTCIYFSLRYRFPVKPFTGDRAVFTVAHYEHVTCSVPNVLDVRNAQFNGFFCPP